MAPALTGDETPPADEPGALAFWERFERVFGEPGEDPPSYWRPDLGNAYFGPGLTPGEIGELTPMQLLAAHDFIVENTKKRGK